MANKNDPSTTFLKIGMNSKNAEKIVNYLIDKNVTMTGTVLLAMLGSKQMYEIIIKKCDPNAKIVIADSDLVTDYFENYKNIICINIDENDADDFYNKLKNMPNFDFVVQNPPYSGSLHLDFLKKGYEMLSDKGQMIIIEPATWLINVRKYGKRGENLRTNSSEIQKYDTIKKMLEKQVEKIIIDNYNAEFNITNTTPFSITHINKTYNSNIIKYINCGFEQIVNSLYDCNNIGDYNLLWSIYNKISSNNTISKHITDKQEDNTYYLLINTDIVATLSNLYVIRPNFATSDSSFYKTSFGDYFQSFICPLMQFKRNDISNIVHKKAARGGSTSKNVKLTNNPAPCLYGSKNELENYKYNICNLHLPMFISVSLIYDAHSAFVRDFIPWLVDKKYTDQEIYDMFNFTDEEIKLIETTIKKYERNSPWFKRYMCGPSEVTDEEVQKFIEDLNYAKG